YVALGHVHKPQCIRGLTHIRYAGSLDRMDFGDTDVAKEVVLVDIGPDGRRGVVPIAIEPTRLEVVTITDPGAAAEAIAAQVPDPGAAVVRVVVEPAAADAGTAVDLAIRSALPNVAAVEWRSPELADGAAARTAPTGSCVRERVLNYLADHAAPEDRDQL